MKSNDYENLPDHISEYFSNQEAINNRLSRDLFQASDKDVEVKTELEHDEIKIISTLKFNDEYLISKGLNPFFIKYYNNYMRLMISKDRKSRQEFVEMNKSEKPESNVHINSNVPNMG